MFNTARTTAEFLMVGDLIKVGGRYMTVVGFGGINFYGRQIIKLSTPNSGGNCMTIDPLKDDKFKVYNQKKK